MAITMEPIKLTDYIRWFSDNHDIKSLDSRIDGVIIASIGTGYLVRLGSVTDGE